MIHHRTGAHINKACHALLGATVVVVVIAIFTGFTGLHHIVATGLRVAGVADPVIVTIELVGVLYSTAVVA